MSQAFYDLFHINEIMPTRIDIYENEEEGIEAFEIEQPPNQYVPEHIQYYEDKKRGIFKLHMGKKKGARRIEEARRRIEYQEEEDEYGDDDE